MKERRKVLGLEAADRLLQNSRTRHAALLETMHEPNRWFTGPWLCKTYQDECRRTRDMIAEATISRKLLETIAEVFRYPIKQESFRRLLSAESLASVPKALIEGPTLNLLVESPAPRPLVNGVSPEVIELLQDWRVPPQVFASLRKMVPERQLKAARLMIALKRVSFHYAQLLSTLTPASQLVDPSRPRKKFVGVTADDLAIMEGELELLNEEFLYCASLRGMWALELTAARLYLDRLLDNGRVVRHLARDFPQHLARFQTVLDIPAGQEALTSQPGKTGLRRPHFVF
ncbi:MULTISPECIES: plasmid partitioning protein RepB C-terminal domain-containing protein [unclassified Mesorhizobium]|uniref:plasmid partitioning protein RepB C-terminal domain-containing protein n=1 Tax=unclassified Mesorhizobium TaxID=325217 RepID=UPI00112973AC|nr:MULTISPECIES: plasmid partitioning protein RepB C-terminal domain-containing protein [unclassified Mesorhizobium]MBZ9739892.1 hypothetical protein [Mesorhizobium sp. CO1-1-4]MBZ9805705.1 hypothetical protein [Mesorhizobium sp. ES1-6]TPL88599.1 hypothetical protein FJ948_20450 [Mesorhizobium sp. B2-3-12]